MAINSTKYYFNQIANVIAPQKYKELLKSKMFTTQDFSTKGNAVKTIIRNLQLQYKDDFKGIYVIYEDDKPIYVGISKKGFD
ncbi:hypothetical protein PPYC1_06465 [Paenibacillus polymyxa]|uniref:hypothetical protein n=1 Tax=Paenibacillus polymyxa TaxID=1406 RepID=UPI0008FCD0C6|nr:hypothetical protein [Paenibacillus polymyxa]APB70021.1 hypothetical protein PPYC1_06465 [Paenibacillus polymyxa]